MAKEIDLQKSGLGDITSILHDRGVSDLSWLNIDPEDYAKAAALPTQSYYDSIPELTKALTYEEGSEGVPVLIPLKPHTVVNTNPLDPPGSPSRDAAAEIVNRVAKNLIAGMKPQTIGERLALEFAPSQIMAVRTSIASVLSERGLMGNVYIDSKHFPRCAQDSEDKKFVATRATSAKYVLAKSDCAGCVHNRGGMCSNLHKQIVGSVSYDRKTFAGYALQLSQQGRLDKENLDEAISGSNEDRKRVLISSFRSDPTEFKRDNGVRTSLHQQAKVVAPSFSEAELAARLSAPRKTVATVSRSFIAASRHILFGGNPDTLVTSTDPEVRKVASDYGILGHTYIDMEVLGGCKKTLDFIHNMDASPDFVLRRAACCGECKDAADGGCAEVKEFAQIVDTIEIGRENFVAALMRAADRGIITIENVRSASTKAAKNSNWRSLVAQANLLETPAKRASYEGAKVVSHYGSSSPTKDMTHTDMVDADEVRKSISHLMNLGASGKSLRDAILQRYTREDLAQVPQVGTRLAKYDGVQGTYFIDPTVYKDYGKGCSSGAKQFRKQGAANVMAGDSCIGCSIQTAPGWCSKYAKPLIRSVPSSVIAAASDLRRRLPVVNNDPVENPVDRYELSSKVTLEPSKRAVLPDIGFANKSVTD